MQFKESQEQCRQKLAYCLTHERMCVRWAAESAKCSRPVCFYPKTLAGRENLETL